MARPWSLPASLRSTQRSHSVSPAAHGVLMLPPRPLTSPALLPATAAAVAPIGAIIGDAISYTVGYALKDRIKSIWPFNKNVALIEQGEKFFAKHGGKAILLGRFVGLIRAIAPFLAGSSGMPLRRFLPYDVIGAGLWGATFCMLGYLFWQSFGTVLDYAKTGALALGSTIVVTAVVVLVRLVRVPANRDRVVAWIRAQERRPVIGHVVRLGVRLGRQPARFALRRVTPGDLGLELTTLLAIGAVGDRMLILVDIEKLMSSAEMGLVEPTLQ